MLAIATAAGLRKDWGRCGALLASFFALMRTGEILSLKVRQVSFHDATSTVSVLLPDSKGTHCRGVAEFVPALLHCHSTVAQTDRGACAKCFSFWSNWKMPYPGHQTLRKVQWSLRCPSPHTACAGPAQHGTSLLLAAWISRRIMGDGRWCTARLYIAQAVTV